MSAPTQPTPELELTPDLVERVMKLSAESKDKLVGMLMEDLDGPADDPEVVRAEWRAEIARRVEAVRSGAMKTYSVEETLAYLRQRLAEGPL